MKCKRCGFVLEEDQKFCNMCGAEQSKVKESRRSEVRSLFGLFKFSSKNHRAMWWSLIIAVLLLVYTLFFDRYGGVGIGVRNIDLSPAAFLILYILYLIVQVIVGFKNPESTYTKRYRYVLRISVGIFIILAVYLFFLNNQSSNAIDFFKKIIGWKI